MSVGRVFPSLRLAFVDKALILGICPMIPFALDLGSLLKFAHSDLLLTIENGLRLQCFPSTHLILLDRKHWHRPPRKMLWRRYRNKSCSAIYKTTFRVMQKI